MISPEVFLNYSSFHIKKLGLVNLYNINGRFKDKYIPYKFVLYIYNISNAATL